MRKSILLVLIAMAAVGFSFGADDWTGVWRIQRYYEGKLDGTYHVHISDAAENRVIVYSDDARPLIIQSVTLGEDKLELQVANSAKQPLPLAFSLTRIKERVSGEWLFSQMQLAEPLKGVAVGFRVLNAGEWQPWAEIEKVREDRLINILGLVRERAPRSTLTQFLEFFKTEIEPKYYFLMQSWLYGDRGDPELTRRKILSELFEKVVAGGKKWSAPERFAALAEKALAAVREREGAQVSVYLVSYPGAEAVFTDSLWTRVPTPEEEADCACKLDLRERFVMVNPSLFTEDRQGDAQMAMHLAYPVLWSLPPPNLALEVFRRSLTLRMALEATKSPSGQLDSNLIDLMKGAFRSRLLEGSTPGFPRTPAEQALAESLGFTVGSDFLNWFKANRPKLVPVRTDEAEVMGAWVEYLTGEAPRKDRKGAKKSH